MNLKPIVAAAIVGFVSLGAIDKTSATEPTEGPLLSIDTEEGHVHDPELEQMLLDLAEGSPVPEGFAAVTSSTTRDLGNGISIHNLGNAPEVPVDALEDAILEWDKVIDRNGAPLDINLYYVNMSGNALAAAGPYMRSVDGIHTPSAVINARAGYDTIPGLPDIYVYLNANRDWGSSGYYDLKSVMLHELGHGLGVVSGYDRRTSTGRQLPTTFDSAFYHDKKTQVHSVHTDTFQVSDNVWMKNTDGTWEKIYAPVDYRQGSSMNHLDEFAYPRGTDGSLMTPWIHPREIIHEVDATTAGLMAQIGWGVKLVPSTPSIAGFEYRTGTEPGLYVGVSPGLSAKTAPALAYNYRVIDSGGFTLRQGSVDAGLVGPNITGYLPNGSYTVFVASRGALGYASPETSFRVDVTNFKSWKWARTWRLYLAVLDRPADEAGLTYWTDKQNTIGTYAVAELLASSPEFEARYGTLTDGEFIDQLYWNVMDRAGDEAGLSYWLGIMENGVTRPSVVEGFSESFEFITKTNTK